MKLFTKDIDNKLFKQYSLGNDLENQMVVAKIFNPYGRGVWYIINSDPQDPDYLWAIVDLFEVEIGSVSRSELETLRVPPFGLGLERDLYWTPMNAAEVFRGLLRGEQYKRGGAIHNDESVQMVKSQMKEARHHTGELKDALRGKSHIEPWVVAKMERASTDLSDVTHYLDGMSEYKNGGGVGKPDWLFIGTYPNAIIYSDKRKEDGGYYYEIGRIVFAPFGVKIYDESPEYRSVVDMIYAESKDIEAKGEVEVSATGQKAKIYKYANGGSVSDLVGKHILIYSMGVNEPSVSMISSARMTPPEYSKRELVLGFRSGAEERIPMSKVNDFMAGKDIELYDGKEHYLIKLANQIYEDGGQIINNEWYVWIKDKDPSFTIEQFIELLKKNNLYVSPEKYAKGGALKYYDDKDEYRISRPSGSIEKEILQRVTLDNEDFVGNFGWKTPQGKMADGYLYKLDDFDKNLVKNIKLKEGEMVFRYINRMTAIGGMKPLIKINIDRELIYFSVSNENDDIQFDTKGTQASWIALIKNKISENKYANGGGVEDNDDDYVAKVSLSYGRSNDGDVFFKRNVDKHQLRQIEEIINQDQRTNKYLRHTVNIDYFEGGESNSSVSDDGLSEIEDVASRYAKGGMATFDDKVKAISSSLEGKKVKKKYQKSYGKRYDKKEAKEAATKIAGAMRAKERLQAILKKKRKKS